MAADRDTDEELDQLESELAELRAAGRYDEAAELLRERGDIERAAALFAAVWQYDRAIALTEGAGLLHAAYEHALTARNEHVAARLLSQLIDRPELATHAAKIAERFHRPGDAARLIEASGAGSDAALLYEQAGELFDAARCHESEGRYLEAGKLYERRLREAPEDTEAALRLGRILAHYGRYEHAIRALQKAAQDEERRGAAHRMLVACFAAIGLEQAAADQLDRLRANDPSLPITVPDFLLESFGDRNGLPSLIASEREDRLLAGRYRVLATLGAGATGRVVRAHDGFYDREVAIKILNVGGAGAGRDAFARFEKEARIAAALTHPHVVRVFEYNPDGPFIVMELMAGGTLEERLLAAGSTVPPVPPSTLGVLLDGLLDALEAVHRRGVVHRDLKPANIFFDATGAPKIGDFGVAHLTDIGSTLTGAMLGTLAYMAPEQITGVRRPSASTDLYALGIVLYRCLTGELPFPGPDFMTQQLEMVPPPPSSIAAAWGAPFDQLVMDLLTKDPDARPESAAVVRARVRPLIASLGTMVEVSSREAASGDESSEHDSASASRSTRSSVPPALERYAVMGAGPDGAIVTRDTLLDRAVRLVACDAALAARLRRFARADGPYLQAVYEIEDEAERAILEAPSGESLRERPVSSSRARTVLAQIRSALERLHRRGMVHGNVSVDSVLVSDGRAVLLLPLAPAAEGATAEDDLAQLDVLAAQLGVRDAGPSNAGPTVQT